MVIQSCKKDIDEIIEKPLGYPPKIEVEGAIAGIVTEQDGSPIEDVRVQVNGQQEALTTNEDGVFFLDKAKLFENGTEISFSRDGYFPMYKTVNASLNERKIVSTKMIPREIIAIIDNSTTSVVELSDQISITFSPNSFMGANGVIINGDINIYGFVIDPFTKDDIDLIPGDLRARDSDFSFYQLGSYLMFYLDAKQTDGISLTLRNPARLNLNIPQIEGEFGVAIPLWSFDLEEQIWVENGEIGWDLSFFGEIDRLDFWNIDAKFPIREVTGKIIDQSGNPFSQKKLRINSPNNKLLTNYGMTDQAGFYRGYIPADEDLLLTLYEDVCEENIHTEEIDPGAEDLSMGEIELDASGIGMSRIELEITDCDQNPISKSYAKIMHENGEELIFTNQEGKVIYHLASCITSFDLAVFDFEAEKGIVAESFPNGLSQNINLGAVSLCDSTNSFFNFRIDEDFFSSKYCFISDISNGIISTQAIDTMNSPGDPNIEAVMNLERPFAEISEGDTVQTSSVDIFFPMVQDLPYQCNIDILECTAIVIFDEVDKELRTYAGKFDGIVFLGDESYVLQGEFKGSN